LDYRAALEFTDFAITDEEEEDFQRNGISRDEVVVLRAGIEIWLEGPFCSRSSLQPLSACPRLLRMIVLADSGRPQR
jgi:hypothetical protein